MSDITDSIEIPKLIIHALCGAKIFCCFGLYSRYADPTANKNNIMALDGGNVPDNEITNCSQCGSLIKVSDLRVVNIEMDLSNTPIYPLHEFNLLYEKHMHRLEEINALNKYKNEYKIAVDKYIENAFNTCIPKK